MNVKSGRAQNEEISLKWVALWVTMAAAVGSIFIWNPVIGISLALITVGTMILELLRGRPE